jgi:hypothetical protein
LGGRLDHYIGGDTEVHILFPSDDPNSPSIDTINIRMSAWETARNDLSALGKVTLGRDAIPEQVLNAFRNEDDFHDAFVFEGEYRDLMSTLAQHEFRVEGLIEPMSRKNTPQSIMQAFALASTDVAEFAKDEPDLARAIYVQGVNLYAVSPEWQELHRWCEDFAAIVATLSAGKVEAELLRGDQPISGFAREDCSPFVGNDKRALIRWKGGVRCPPEQVRVRFYLNRARLYSFEWLEQA